MDFTVEELKALEEQKLIRDEAEGALKRAKHNIENIEEEARCRAICNRLTNCAPRFLPPFKAEKWRIFFFVSGFWWDFPVLGSFFKWGWLHVFVYRRDENQQRYAINFTQHGYKICDDGFNPPLELIALGTYLMHAYYLKQDMVFDESTMHPINNPLL